MYSKLNKILNNKILILIILLFLPIIIELLVSNQIIIDKSSISRFLFIYGVYFLIGIFYVLKKKSNLISQILDFIIKHRYIISIIVFLVLFLLRINFSSIDIWCNIIGESENKSTLIGNPKTIRSDEWLVLTPMMEGQAKSPQDYPIYNNNIQQGTLNMLMINTPVRDILAISRPFSWGFLLFGQEYGYSFYWSLKIVLLILLSMEIVLKISEKDKLLSVVGGIILGLAPAMMWWLSTSVVDAYIFGLATVILFSYYMNNLDWKIWKKISIAIGFLICIPAFAFTLYPAFQVPFAIFMLVLMLNDFIPNVKKLKRRDYIIMSITILGIVGMLARFILISWEDIKVMMGTVYPGERFEYGGDFSLNNFISYLVNIFLPYTDKIANASETSSYIYPFIALLILIIYSVRNMKYDKKEKSFKLQISLIALFIFYSVWEFIGFNKIFAQLTFMYYSPTIRTHIVLGIIGVLLCIMLLKKIEHKEIFTKLQSVMISIVVVMFAHVLIKNSSYAEFFTILKLEIVYVMLFTMTYFLIRGNKKAWCYTMLIISIVAGITVNPIAIGTKPIDNTTLSEEIKKINETDINKLWIADSNFTGQYLIANGANCLNGVNVYPNFKWLNIVDPEKKYNEVYNRYAHIHVKLGDNTNFELTSPDAYTVTLTYDNVKNLNIKYYLTLTELSEEDIANFNLSSVYSNETYNQYIYEFNY